MKGFLKRLTAGSMFYPALYICAASFLAGGLVGTLMSINTGSTEQVAATLSGFATAETVGLLPAAYKIYLYPTLALLLGLSLVGAVAIPILVGLRGFLLAFAITAFGRVYGAAGVGYAFSLFFVQLVAVMPILLFLSARGLQTSYELLRMAVTGKKPLVFQQRYLLTSLICVVVLLVTSLLECYLTPALALFFQRFVIL